MDTTERTVCAETEAVRKHSMKKSIWNRISHRIMRTSLNWKAAMMLYICHILSAVLLMTTLPAFCPAKNVWKVLFIMLDATTY